MPDRAGAQRSFFRREAVQADQLCYNVNGKTGKWEKNLSGKKQEQENMQGLGEVNRNGNSAGALILLLRCAITGEKPETDCLQNSDLSALYALAERHSLAGATNIGLESIGIRDDRFREAYGKTVRKVLSMETDMRKLLSRLEEHGIWYMPLKGAILKDYYPRIGMREMTDYDILYDEKHSDDVRTILTDMGYKVEEFDMHNVDSYIKPPTRRFEMHRQLFPTFSDEHYTYYKDVKQRLVKDTGNRFGWHFSREDLYVYLMAHEYKHYLAGGIGLRFLLDTWVYLRKHGNEMNWGSIDRELETLGIKEFEEENRHLALSVFQGEPMNPKQKKMLDFILGSGTFGTMENAVQQQVERFDGGVRGKLRYAKDRILLSKEGIQSAYPFFYRHKVLIPFLYPYRIWRMFFRSREKTVAELRALLGASRKGKKKS